MGRRVRDATLQQFFEARFREELKPAFEAWVAADPFQDPTVPLAPFAMPQYQLEAKAQTERLDAAATRSSDLRDEYLQRSANYVLAVVFFAVVLFFAGISTKLTSRRYRMVLVGAGCLLFVAAVGWITTFPVVLTV